LFNQFDSKQNKTIHWTNIKHIVTKMDLSQNSKLDFTFKSAEEVRLAMKVDENGYVQLAEFHGFIAKSIS